MQKAQDALKLAQEEAQAAKVEAEEHKRKLEDLEKGSKADLEKAQKYSEKVEGRLRALVDKIAGDSFLFFFELLVPVHSFLIDSRIFAASSGVPLSLADADVKTEELLVNMKTSLERWFQNVYPEGQMPSSLEELLRYFSAPEDPLKKYRNSKLKEGAESALLMALGHGVERELLEKVAESFPTDTAGKEVDVAPFTKLAGRLAKKIVRYLNDRMKEMNVE